MKAIRNIYRNVKAFLRAISRKVDKNVIVPITKFILWFTEKLGKNGKTLEKWLTRKNTLTFISLIMALLFFFLVDNKSLLLVETSAEVIYNQPVTAVYNEEAYVIEGLPEKVDITLIGRRSDLYLAKQLPTHNVTIDISNLKPGTHKVALKYKQAINSIDFKLDPSVATVIIYPKLSETRTVNVDLLNKDKLDSKLFIQNVAIDRDDVIIKGAEHVLKQVATVKALVDISDLADPAVGVSSLKDIPLIAYDQDGKVVNVEMVPNKINATISIISPSKEVPIKVIPTGSVVFGKAVSSTTSDVTKVMVYGDEEAINNLQYVPVEIDVTDLKDAKEYNIVLKKPAGVRYMSVSTITVKVTLDTEITREISNVLVEHINLDSNYQVQALGAEYIKIPVILKGTEAVLNSIDVNTIKAVVNLSGYGLGDHEVDVAVSGDEVKATYTPKIKKIKIRITKK